MKIVDIASSRRESNFRFLIDEAYAAVPSKLFIATGEKSVVAGRGKFMSMGILESADGTTAPDGTLVDFYSNGEAFARGVTKGGVAYVYHNPLKDSGVVEITARHQEVKTLYNHVRVVPADPVALNVGRTAISHAAQNEAEVWVRTNPLEDQFGNRLADGSLVQFSGTDENGRKILLHSLSINGIATAKLVNRNLTNAVEFNARLKDVSGSSTSFKFEEVEIAPEMPLEFENTAGQMRVRVGPVLRKSGGFVPDGVHFKIFTPDGQLYDSVSSEGFVEFRLSFDQYSDVSKFRIEAARMKWIASFVGSSLNKSNKLQLNGEKL